MRKFLIAFALLFSFDATAQTAKGILSSDFSLPNQSFAVVPFDARAFDVPQVIPNLPGPGIGEPGTLTSLFFPGGKVIILNDGIYFFFGEVSFDTSCVGIRSIGLVKNGNFRDVFGSNGIHSPPCDEPKTLSVQGMGFFRFGDFVTLNAYQDSGNPLKLRARLCSQADCASATWLVVIRVW